MRNRFENFSSSILELNRCVQKIKEMEMKDLGLKSTHGMCLYYLSTHKEGLTSAELTGLCREDKAAISRAVKFLMEQEMVRSENSEMNTGKRNYRNKLYLTEKGDSVAKTINLRIEKVLQSCESNISNEERAVMYDALDKLYGNFLDYIERNE